MRNRKSEQMREFEVERRRHLIEATIETVAKVGFRSASLSAIANRAGVSQGLFAHYFGDKDGLLEATLRFMAARLTAATAARLRRARTPLERVLAVPESALATEEFDPKTSAVWLAFWGQIMHSDAYRRVQSIYLRRMRSNLRHGLRSLVAPEHVETCAILIAAAIDGLWLHSHAGTPLGEGRARAIVRILVARLVDNAAIPAFETLEHTVEISAAQRISCENLISDAMQGQIAWRKLEGARRVHALECAAHLIRTEAHSLARALARDTGRPVAEIERYDIVQVAYCFQQAAELASLPLQERYTFDQSEFGYIEREPIDVVLAPGHWNSSLVSSCKIAAPALALGGAIIACVSGTRARALDQFSQLLRRAGFPEGAFTVAQGTLAESLLRWKPEAAVVQDYYNTKSAVVILEDADLELASSSLVRGPRNWARSRSFSETLIFIPHSAQTEFISSLRAQAQSLVIGNPLEKETEIGRLISKTHLDEVLSNIQEASSTGARIRLGGRKVETIRGRAIIFEPTILDNCRIDMRISRHNLYCPIFIVIPFKSDSELECALRSLSTNLSMGLFGQELDRIWRIARNARASICLVNDTREVASPLQNNWLHEENRKVIVNCLTRTRKVLAIES